MSSEIVERLRRGIVWDEVIGEVREMMTEDLMGEAADHIEALEAENERLRGRVTNPMLVAGLVRADELGYKMQDWEVNAIILSALSQAKE